MIDHDATDQLAALRAGTVTARDLMAQTLDRIDRLNPALNAIVALRDRDTLLDEAEYATPGPLQGLPMAIKDLAETAGIVTSYGSPAFRDNVPDEDSSATCPSESVLPIRLRPDFSVVFVGYVGGAEHWPRRQVARERSLRADILRTS